MDRIKVGVNGYGVIGKRVADAVHAQPDMQLTGVADIVTDWRIQSAVPRLPVFAATPDAHSGMVDTGIRPEGTLDDLLAQSDVIVDTTPKHVAAGNLPRYQAAGVKVIVQGGEAHSTTGHSFVAQANYATALGRDLTRVVSCNTTSIVRVLGALENAGLLLRARGVLIRRATDPWESHLGGIMNTMVPEPVIPSHQGPDAKTVLPDLDVVTIAAKGAHTQTHNHYWTLQLTRRASRDEVLDALRAAPRIAFIRMSDGLVALNSTVELMRDLGRPRGDMWEVAVWEDLVTVDGDEAYLTYQVCNEAIVIPETVDAIRALTGTVTDPAASIRLTDATLGMRQDFLAPERS
ncbi:MULTISPECIES: type II glyceraldehyde-3-phosphate dehydrogenase [Microbacterium]|jgi:glyceraldehyde-3-phosphate dehydrogenase (NAD(P))|uniref:type II glyceraldehyde-3-phosphate dehydrogenase n=1 Tax=Microbacterium TaxID=33882 RepID=UPI001984E415|nr:MULTISPECIES: type II glyceraldehyde-3-phosphate dehydrogenase [Microbacterium]MBD3758506.1 type II glyceraldehyde-3-phosphate dehydrogenase [Microbacterium sp.]MBZ6372835.1 type II glyceraldehyde-3-phosphate dehydrogenase [Microbacterium hominis]